MKKNENMTLDQKMAKTKRDSYLAWALYPFIIYFGWFFEPNIKIIQWVVIGLVTIISFGSFLQSFKLYNVVTRKTEMDDNDYLRMIRNFNVTLQTYKWFRFFGFFMATALSAVFFVVGEWYMFTIYSMATVANLTLVSQVKQRHLAYQEYYHTIKEPDPSEVEKFLESLQAITEIIEKINKEGIKPVEKDDEEQEDEK